ncbi:uncharacterized protein E0L32_005700 [Thyridium curvatum]|uniref:FCP1 homology domain-containing protein n=1 Tax=Thyridium curvatum TaxID=1093900 RepID=A0A507BBL4_9PEZI|nr:uncharacterized protein E0L32_005700 [Thyridium curvatum]TPX14000.1 hypothetical protein E0L32_005700 [Thyridium curvatum]
MNSLNIISGRVSPSTSPSPSRSNSITSLGLAVTSEDSPGSGEPTDREPSTSDPASLENEKHANHHHHHHRGGSAGDGSDESTPLLSHGDTKDLGSRSSVWHTIPKRIASTFLNSIRWVLSTLAAPGVYLIACLYDENGNFAPLLQLRKLFGAYNGDVRKMTAEYQAMDEKDGGRNRTQGGRIIPLPSRPPFTSGSSSSGMSSESDSDMERQTSTASPTSRHTRSKSLQSSEEIAPARRSIRIKLHNDETLRQRKHRKAQSTSMKGSNSDSMDSKDISAQLKSPTSPIAALTKYPKTPAPPRPLIPRRQPSYLNIEPTDRTHQKTLILDLDETLIHSMSKGGRMSSGHMVEVRLTTTYVGAAGQQSLGPQHPILYYVHKRPFCDDFLRRVCKWYNLVVFTASVQEYADPVIDWLESERKFFSRRYYRQHCTYRAGAFIKDLSSVEPDLSKVMILDNSPLSYMFHQDNAIPIQGWINDPTDYDLMHLIPLFEGLQYVSDVRALLALRNGEEGQQQQQQQQAA